MLLSATRPQRHKHFLDLRAVTQAASRLRRLLAVLLCPAVCARLCTFAMLLLHYLPLEWLIAPAAQQYGRGRGLCVDTGSAHD